MTGPPKTYDLKHQTSGGMTGYLGIIDMFLVDPKV